MGLAMRAKGCLHLIRRLRKQLLCGLLALGLMAVLGGCQPQSAEACLGDISYQNPKSVLRLEPLDDEGIGVVYREIKSVKTYFEKAPKPLWIFLYHSLDPVFRDLIPFAEQATEAYQGKAEVILLEVEANPEWEAIWKPKQLPFMMVLNHGQRIYQTDAVAYPTLLEAIQKLDELTGLKASIPLLERAKPQP